MKAKALMLLFLVMSLLAVAFPVTAMVETPQSPLFHFEVASTQEIHSQFQEAAWYRLGISYLESGYLLEAINAFHFSIECNPQFGEAYQALGYAYFLMGDFQQSAMALATAIEINPEAAHAHHLMGVIFTIYAMYENAIAELEQAVLMCPDNAMIHYDLGFAFEFNGGFARARESYEKALQINPDFVEAKNRLKGILNKLREPPQEVGR